MFHTKKQCLAKSLFTWFESLLDHRHCTLLLLFPRCGVDSSGTVPTQLVRDGEVNPLFEEVFLGALQLERVSEAWVVGEEKRAPQLAERGSKKSGRGWGRICTRSAGSKVGLQLAVLKTHGRTQT